MECKKSTICGNCKCNMQKSKTQDAARKSLKLKTFMNICESLSALSHDEKYKVATIITDDNFREVYSIGYNGDYKSGPNIRTDFDHGQSGFLHSEENALMHLSKPYELRANLILFCTHKPCTMCAKRIANSGIKKIVYKNEYEDALNQTDEIFLRAGVSCHNFEVLYGSIENL